MITQIEMDVLKRAELALNKINEVELRDVFAMQAMNGYLSGCSSYCVISPEEIAKDAYKLADAMLEARSKK